MTLPFGPRLLASFDPLDAIDFLESHEIDWCEDCGLPDESCCCPEGGSEALSEWTDREFDEGEQ